MASFLFLLLVATATATVVVVGLATAAAERLSQLHQLALASVVVVAVAAFLVVKDAVGAEGVVESVVAGVHGCARSVELCGARSNWWLG
jgi:hypothetical protein